MFGLSKSQKKVLFAVNRVIMSGELPTYQGIANALNYKSRSTVHAIWERLIERGYGKKIKNRYYTMALTAEGEKYIKMFGGK
jgi:Mn-dependent DtxR family transcriptional regulator